MEKKKEDPDEEAIKKETNIEVDAIKHVEDLPLKFMRSLFFRCILDCKERLSVSKFEPLTAERGYRMDDSLI